MAFPFTESFRCRIGSIQAVYNSPIAAFLGIITAAYPVFYAAKQHSAETFLIRNLSGYNR